MNALDIIYGKLKDMPRPELFLYESLSNHYQPAPPEGYFGMRSQSNRVFVPNQYRGTEFDLGFLIDSGIAIKTKL